MLTERHQQLPDPNGPNSRCLTCGRPAGYRPPDIHRKGSKTRLVWHHLLLPEHRQQAGRHLRYQLRDWRLPSGQQFSIDDMVPICVTCHKRYHQEIRQHKQARLGDISLDEWLRLYPGYGYLIYAQPEPRAQLRARSAQHRARQKAFNRILAQPVGKSRLRYLARQLPATA